MAVLCAELALAASCCRWPPGPAIDEAIRAAAGQAIDWPLFERVVQRHRIAALVHDAMRRTGIPATADISIRMTARQRGSTARRLPWQARRAACIVPLRKQAFPRSI